MNYALSLLILLTTACTITESSPDRISSGGSSFDGISPALSDVSTNPKYNADSNGYGGFSNPTDGDAVGSAPEVLAARAFCENGYTFTLEVKLHDPEGLDGVYWVGADFGDRQHAEIVDQLWLEPTSEPGLWRAEYREWDTALDCSSDYDVLFEVRDDDGWSLYEIVPFGANAW